MPTLLIVEDNTMNLDMLVRRFEWEGFATLTAPNGAVAVALAQEALPDLIIMDMRLPILDGWQATQQLKMLPAAQAIPIIALTADVLPQDRQRCLDAGCDAYASKPVDFDQLLLTMRQLLAAREHEVRPSA